uniref:Uncharacterized protein n=1 Tax=Ascaris lumbricoides TaxID=6252 RepID=A0A9J2P582_ASCLU
MRFRGPFSCRSIGFPFVRDVLVDSLSAHILPMLPVMGCLSDAQVSHLNLHRSYRALFETPNGRGNYVSLVERKEVL